MNVTTINAIRAATESANVPDEKMDQVRELLFGDFARQSEGRLQVLETRVRELELSVHRRLDALQARLEALGAEIDANQRSSFEEIARGIDELGQRVRRVNRD
ncbi:MAG: hypothetical protein R3D27_01180 [Hyphomicrobiaceae bacterium]